MRIVAISYSHHGRGIARIVQELGHDIVAVVDSETEPRELLQHQFKCPSYSDVTECIDEILPDAVIVCGHHIAIPNYLRACVNRRIPYLLDKPFADCADRLRPVAEATINLGIPHALTLPNRGSLLIKMVAEMINDGSLGELVLYSSRLNNGPPTRYDQTPSYWLNLAARSGGGSWIVEGSHGIDTFLQFAEPGKTTVVGAVISNLLHRRTVEDTAVGIIRTETGVTGIIESGYNYPSGVRSGDHFFRFVGSKATVIERYGDHGEPLIEVHSTKGVDIIPDNSHDDRMRHVIKEGIIAIENGKVAVPNVMQAVRILEIQDKIYEFARDNQHASGPFPLEPPIFF